MAKIRLLLIIAGIILAQATELTLVKDGKEQAVILLDANNNTKSAQMGAFELQYHIAKATGVKLPIVTEPQEGKISIKIGGGDIAGLKGDGHRIRFADNEILLTGCDTQDFRTVNYDDVNTFPLALAYCNGSLFAVYDFLETYCGVRFLYIDDQSTVVRKVNTLTINGKDRDFESPMDAFRWIYVTADNFATGRDYELLKLRWRMCIFYGRNNHNQYSIYFAHWAPAKDPKLAAAFKGKREELFAQGYKGKMHSVDSILRKNYPNDPDIPPQLCYSNPKTVKYYANEVLTYARGQNVLGGWGNPYGTLPTTTEVLPHYPGKPFFYPIQGGDTGGYCTCEKCKTRFKNDEKNIANNKFQFIADIANEVAQTDPTAGVSTLAYIHTLYYPDAVVLPPNISVQLCLLFYSWWHPVAYEKQMAEYQKWIDKEAKRRPLTLWTYLFGTHRDAMNYGNYKPFPGFYPWKTGEYFKRFAADGIRGNFSETEMHGNALEAYVAARMCYDPSLDVNALLDDYFDYAFGEAAPYAKEFYKEIENAYWNLKMPPEYMKDPSTLKTPAANIHPFWSAGLSYPDLNWTMATPERMTKLSGLVEEMKKHVKTDTEKMFFQRLEALWNETLAGQEEYARMKIIKDMPKRALALNQSADLDGDLKRVDWNKAAVTEKWCTLMGMPSDSQCTARVAADSKWLYLELRDPKGADVNATRQDDFEIFMPTQKGYPMYQLCISPKGMIDQLKLVQTNDKVVMENYDFNLKSSNRFEKGEWIVRLAIPRDRLPFADNLLRVNFFRTEKTGAGTYKAWNPIFTGSYRAGADRAGSIMIFPLVIEEDEFYHYKKDELSGRCVDAAAFNGKTNWMDGTCGWALRYNGKDSFPAGKYLLSVRIRTETTDSEDMNLSVGIYDMKAKKVTISRVIPIKECEGKEYKQFEVGIGEFGPGKSFFVGGFSKKTGKGKFFVDSIQFSVPQKTAP